MELVDFVLSPSAIPLVVTELLLIVSWLIEFVAEKSVKVDPDTLTLLKRGSTEDRAKQRLFAYCKDMAWRVTLLATFPALIVSAGLQYQGIVSSGAGILFAVFSAVGMLVIVAILYRFRNPDDCRVAFTIFNRWVISIYFLTAAGVFLANALLLFLTYLNCLEPGCSA